MVLRDTSVMGIELKLKILAKGIHKFPLRSIFVLLYVFVDIIKKVKLKILKILNVNGLCSTSL